MTLRHFAISHPRQLAEAIGAADFSVGRSWVGETYRAALGDLELNRTILTNINGVKRTADHIARNEKNRFMFSFMRAGSVHLDHCGRESWVPPGTFTLVDLDSPYAVTRNAKTDNVAVTIPTTVMLSLTKNPRRYCARLLLGRSGAGRIVADFLLSLLRQLPNLSEDMACRYSGRILDLISIMLEAGESDIPIEQTAVHDALYERCLTFIEKNLASPHLSPDRIASANGISVRYLYKIFHKSGESVTDFIWRLRSRRSYRDLTDINKTSILIKEIAFENGFRSQAHFSNVIKRHYGTAPNQLRPARLKQ